MNFPRLEIESGGKTRRYSAGGEWVGDALERLLLYSVTGDPEKLPSPWYPLASMPAAVRRKLGRAFRNGRYRYRLELTQDWAIEGDGDGLLSPFNGRWLYRGVPLYSAVKYN